jgi:hypothetical protein
MAFGKEAIHFSHAVPGVFFCAPGRSGRKRAVWKRQLILSVLWLAAVGWYWREYVPLLPTRSAKLQYESFWAGWTSEGHVVVSGGELDLNGVYVKKYSGPISFWRVPDLEKISGRLGVGDEIETHHMYAGEGLVVVGMDSQVQRRIVDVNTGVTLEDVPGEVQKIAIGPGPDPKVIYVCADSITLRDPRLSTDLWTVTGVSAQNAEIHHGLVLLYRPKSVPSGPGPSLSAASGIWLLKMGTGEFETRFDAARPFESLAISEDGRWALVYSRGRTHVFDARTARSLWTLPAQIMHWPQFDTKRGELCLHWATPAGELHESRWRCSDGTPLTPPPTHFAWAHRTIDAAGRYAIDTTTPRGHLEEFIRSCVNPILRAIGSKRQLPEERTIRVLRDVLTNDVIGPLPADRFVGFVPGRTAAVAIGGNRIDVYEFPASRDWGWLAWWGLTPVAIAFGARIVRLVRRRRVTPG